MVELLFESLKEKKDKIKLKYLKQINNKDKSKQPHINVSVNQLLASQNSYLNNLKPCSIKNLPKINDCEDNINNNAIRIIDNKIISYSQIKKQNEPNNKNCNIYKNKIDCNNFQVKRYEKMELFPYRYYLCTAFIKNIDIKNLTNFFSKKFSKVYLFLNKMFDISSYLILQREFQILKNTILKVDDINIIEKDNKINVNEVSFIRNMNECIEKGKFQIFSQNINRKEKNL